MKRYGKLWLAAVIILLISVMLPGLWILYQKRAGMVFVRQLGAGINIGNSLDVYKLKKVNPNATAEDYETYWGNPPITGALFEEIKRAGFETVRIPVSWGEHMDSNCRIDAEWMRRVAEVVNMALDSGLYVILNIHHEKWLIPTREKEGRAEEILCALWKQIAETFADRGEKLLFEAMNEPRVEGDEEWTSGTSEYREVINRLNQAFVDVIRSCSGYNRKRWLLLPAYGSTRRETALSELRLPRDSRLIVSVHAYIPYTFTIGDEKYDSWDVENEEDTEEIEELMERLERLFLKKNIPVVITEFGCHDKNNPDAMKAWAGYYTELAEEKGIPLIWWDNGKESGLIDRNDYTWTQPELAEILTGNAVGRK